MEMRFEYIDNVLIAHVQCYLDQMGAENFKYVLAERMKEGEKVVLDLEKLVNIDNFGLDALLAVAQKAIERQIGARGLRAVMEEVMIGVMYLIPSDLSIKKVVITADCVRGGKPKILRDKENPREPLGAGN